MAPPIEWDFSEQKLTWLSVRGRIGFRDPDQLVVKGQGKSPLIISPPEPAIDWSRYEAVLIRMVSEGSGRIKLKFPQQEYVKQLGEPLKFRVYRFDLGLKTAGYQARLVIEPTDSPNDLAAIDYIKLVPRRIEFPKPVGLSFIRKRDEYRHVLYAHSPSSITYEVAVPEQATLRFGVGVADRPVEFRVKVGEDLLYSDKIIGPEHWREFDIDLARFAGQKVKLVFETAGDEGAVGLWATPILTAARPSNKPNVLVYLIDTLRADHTSVHGYRRDTTPFLKQLGGEGVVFEDCQAQSTWTKPSVASLLTSLHTPAHGIQEFDDIIPRGAVTLAATLRRNGYVTASILGNPFPGRATGLERGVDHLMEYPVVQRAWIRSERATDSAALNRVAFSWLDRHHDAPFYLYLHSTDPHAPYAPPASTESKFANPAETREFNRDSGKLRQVSGGFGGGAVFNRKQARAKGVDPDAWVRRAIDRYDGEIAFNDSNIKILVEKLADLGILDNTLIVVVSDHGEEFLEHGWTTHGHSLYSEVSHVLCLMWNPRLIPEPRRVSAPAQLIDVMPTVLDLLGIPPPEMIEGESLKPLIGGQPFERTAPAMAMRLARTDAPPPASGLGIPENRIDTMARFDAKWKLIYRPEGKSVGLPEVELYDRAADPGDAHNVAAGNAAVTARLVPEVKQWRARQEQIHKLLGETGKKPLGRDTLEKLRSLGYISPERAAPEGK